MYHMPALAAAYDLNHSALPHARQISDAESHPVRDAVRALAAALTGLRTRYGR